MKLIVGLDFGTSTTVVRYCMEGSDVVQKLEDKGKTVIPTLIFRRNSQTVTEYGTDAEKAILLDKNGQKGECIANFKIDLLASQDSEKRKSAESYVEEFLSNHIFKLLNEATKGLMYDEILVYVSYPAKWTTGMSEYMQDIVRKSITRYNDSHAFLGYNCNVMVKGITEPLAAAYNFIHTRQKELIDARILKRGGAPINIFMLDMGAGTSDITIFQLKIDENDIPHAINAFPYPSVDNPSLCGGHEIDEIVRNYILDYCRSHGSNIPDQNFRMQEAKVYKENVLSQCLNNDEDCDFPPALELLRTQNSSLLSFRLNRTSFEAITHEHWDKLYKLIEAAMLNYPHAKAEDIDLLCLTGGHSQWYAVENLFNGKGIYGSIGKEGDKSTHILFKKLIAENWRITALKEVFPQESVATGLCHIGKKIVFEQCSANNVWVQFAINDAVSDLKLIVEAGQSLPIAKEVKFDLGVIAQDWNPKTFDDYRGYFKVYTGKELENSNCEKVDLSYSTGFFAMIFNVKYNVSAFCKIEAREDNTIKFDGNMNLIPTNTWFNTKVIPFDKR